MSTQKEKINHSKPIPRDLILYNKTKKEIYKKYPKHSAYRSGILVKTYKRKFTDKYGTNKVPYVGNKTSKKGLSRWFKEEWVNQRGKIGYKFKSDVYRPSKRITKKTPITHNELTKKEITKARRIKYKSGRIKRFKPLVGGKHKMLSFDDYPDFVPNLTPKEMFELGSFGGTYWRPIYSKVVKKTLKNIHKKYPKEWWENIDESFLSCDDYDKSKNKYNVKVGTSLEFWESKNWITEHHPYGWVHWYCDFYLGKRSDDDSRQVKRWKALAGPKGRFMRFLATQILKKKGKYDDESISPKIRQVLQHWGYVLTEKDFKFEVNRRKK